MDFVYVHVWVCTHHSMRVEGVGSFLLPHGSSGLNTGHRGWLAPSVLTITTLPAPAELVCVWSKVGVNPIICIRSFQPRQFHLLKHCCVFLVPYRRHAGFCSVPRVWCKAVSISALTVRITGALSSILKEECVISSSVLTPDRSGYLESFLSEF